MTITQLSRAAIKQLRTNHVLYVDRGVVVLNKPAGLICQKQTSINAFDTLLNEIQGILGQEGPMYPLHRLDKGTTGALVLARTLPLAREMSRQLQNRTLTKSYLALVDTPKARIFNKQGTFRLPLLIEDGRVSISSKGKEAITEYRVIGEAKDTPVSLLQLNLVTGLKHQLRIHLAQGLLAPIRGDSFYRRGRATSHPDQLFLHASEVSMTRYRKHGPSKKFTLGVYAPLSPLFTKECEALGLSRFLSPAQILGGVYADGIELDDESMPELEGLWTADESASLS